MPARTANQFRVAICAPTEDADTVRVIVEFDLPETNSGVLEWLYDLRHGKADFVAEAVAVERRIPGNTQATREVRDGADNPFYPFEPRNLAKYIRSAGERSVDYLPFAAANAAIWGVAHAGDCASLKFILSVQ